MPQGHATQPFKAPLDESKVIIEWKKYTDEWGNKFPDGESYDWNIRKLHLLLMLYMQKMKE